MPATAGVTGQLRAKDLARVADIKIVFRSLRPGQRDKPIQIGTNDAIFGGGNFMTAKTSPRQALPEAGAFANRRWYCLFRTAAVGMLWVASRRPH